MVYINYYVDDVGGCGDNLVSIEHLPLRTGATEFGRAPDSSQRFIIGVVDSSLDQFDPYISRLAFIAENNGTTLWLECYSLPEIFGFSLYYDGKNKKYRSFHIRENGKLLLAPPLGFCLQTNLYEYQFIITAHKQPTRKIRECLPSVRKQDLYS